MLGGRGQRSVRSRFAAGLVLLFLTAHAFVASATHFHRPAAAAADPALGVVDAGLRVHGTDGLYVADGSVVPSALGVNPQVTIMALATRLARRLLT